MTVLTMRIYTKIKPLKNVLIKTQTYFTKLFFTNTDMDNQNLHHQYNLKIICITSASWFVIYEMLRFLNKGDKEGIQKYNQDIIFDGLRLYLNEMVSRD